MDNPYCLTLEYLDQQLQKQVSFEIRTWNLKPKPIQISKEPPKAADVLPKAANVLPKAVVDLPKAADVLPKAVVDLPKAATAIPKQPKSPFPLYPQHGGKDSLFWCYYIWKYGLFKYEVEIKGQYFVAEKEEKFQCIDLIRKHKAWLKAHGVKLWQKLEDDLGVSDQISVCTFFVLVLLTLELGNHQDKGISLRLNSHQRLDMGTHPSLFVDKNKHHQYFLTDEEWTCEKPMHIILNPFTSALKCIGSYRVDGLREMCAQVGISEQGLKQDLYDRLFDFYRIV